MDTTAKVLEIVAAQANVGRDAVSSDTKLTDDLRLDSLDLVDISLAIEEQLAVDFPDELMRDVKTVKDLIQKVEAALKE